MSATSHTLLNTILGAGTVGENYAGTATINDPAVVQQCLDYFKKEGYLQIDTARVYGTSEQMLASLKAQEQGFIIDTKIKSFLPGSHTPENLKLSFKESLESLNVKKVHILYLHAPDRATPFEDTLRAVNEIYKEGSFEKFGLSNYTTEEVEKIVKISRENNYVLPTVYQGLYNAVARKNEDTLFPLLHKEKISFYAWSPVASGFFEQRKGQEYPEGARFNAKTFGGNFRNLYFKDSYFAAVERLSAVTKKFGLSNTEVAIRWIYFHSQLKKENGDAVLFGVSPNGGLQQLVSNIEAAKKGPLPNELVTLLEEIWNDVRADAPAYHF